MLVLGLTRTKTTYFYFYPLDFISTSRVTFLNMGREDCLGYTKISL